MCAKRACCSRKASRSASPSSESNDRAPCGKAEACCGLAPRGNSVIEPRKARRARRTEKLLVARRPPLHLTTKGNARGRRLSRLRAPALCDVGAGQRGAYIQLFQA